MALLSAVDEASRTVAVTWYCPGHQTKDLLEEDAFVRALRLLEGGDPDQLLAGKVHGRRTVPLEGEGYAVARDERVAFPLKCEGAVLEGEPEHRDDRVAGPGGERDGADERHRIARREPAEALVELRRIEKPGERFGGSRLLLAADPFPAPAADDGSREDGDRHQNEPTHVRHPGRADWTRDASCEG